MKDDATSKKTWKWRGCGVIFLDMDVATPFSRRLWRRVVFANFSCNKGVLYVSSALAFAKFIHFGLYRIWQIKKGSKLWQNVELNRSWFMKWQRRLRFQFSTTHQVNADHFVRLNKDSHRYWYETTNGKMPLDTEKSCFAVWSKQIC